RDKKYLSALTTLSTPTATELCHTSGFQSRLITVLAGSRNRNSESRPLHYRTPYSLSSFLSCVTLNSTATTDCGGGIRRLNHRVCTRLVWSGLVWSIQSCHK